MKVILLLLLLLPVTSLAQSVEDCMECHADNEMTGTVNDTLEISVYVDLETYKQSIHGDLDCVDCHSSVKDVDHEEELPQVVCAECHEDAQKAFDESIHAHSGDHVPGLNVSCSDCHGKHDIFPSDQPQSKTYRLNIESTCAECHTRPAVLEVLGIKGQGPVEGYHASIHNKLLHEAPEKNPPTCINCHDYHAIYVMSNPKSKFSKLNVSETCGACHKAVKADYEKSEHWRSIQHGHLESPTCNDCHGEHGILSPTEKDALTNKFNLSSQICSNCHSSPNLMQRFGLDHERFTTYSRTYHGLAVVKGSPDAANCTSCHEVHAIMDEKNPASSINPANLEKTCAKCHEDVTPDFARITVHPLNLEERNPAGFLAKNIYIWLIIVTIGGMILHNLIIYRYYLKKKRQALNHSRMIQRFQRFEIYQHALLFISFITLVITGFALKFPNAMWVEALTFIGMDENIRSVTHRTAGVILITISFVQLFYFLLNRRGRKEMIDLMPKIADVTGFWQNMKYYLGRSGEHPKFGRWDYTEKAEYLALIWGTAVMALTGLVLWFPEFFIRHLPSWVFELSEIVHYYEAWLATLAIIIWHWFFVIFHPEKYPMSLTWMDGKISEEEMKSHHPLEYAQKKREQSSERDAEPGAESSRPLQ
jgi:formate dehydrogenase gamma subunit